MRAFLLALALLTGFAAAPSAAAVKPAAAGSEAPVPKKITPPPKVQPAAAKPKTAPAAAPLVTTPIISPMPTDSGDCRLGCARAYYFCLANDGADSCGTTWTGCRSDCARAANP